MVILNLFARVDFILRSLRLTMLVRKLTSLAAVTTPAYAFGVDAKKIVIGVPKDVYQN